MIRQGKRKFLLFAVSFLFPILTGVIMNAVYGAMLGLAERPAAGAAGHTSYADSLPEGLEFRIFNDGHNVSGGEKARTALARELIRGTGLPLFDEPFARLDDAAIDSIEDAPLGMRGKTAVNVSHVADWKTAARYDGVLLVRDQNAVMYQKEEIGKLPR